MASDLSMTTLVQLAKGSALFYGLDPSLVCAVCEQESGDRKRLSSGWETWNPWAFRAEPAFDARYVQPLHLTPTEDWGRSISWGLMQVMGETAREHGFMGSFPALCEPEMGLEFGTKVLKAKLAAGGSEVHRGLQLWNGGGNPGYADEVLARVSRYRLN